MIRPYPMKFRKSWFTNVVATGRIRNHQLHKNRRLRNLHPSDARTRSSTMAGLPLLYHPWLGNHRLPGEDTLDDLAVAHHRCPRNQHVPEADARLGRGGVGGTIRNGPRIEDRDVGVGSHLEATLAARG